MIPAIPPLAAALGVGLVHLARPARRGLAVALAVSVIALGLVWLHPRVGREQWREAAAIVASEARPGDAVLALGVPDGHLLRHYLPPCCPTVLGASAGIPAPVPGGGRLFLVPSIHTTDLEEWRATLAGRGWREGVSTSLVMVRVLRFDP